MGRIDDAVIAALRTLPPKPEDAAQQHEKKSYSEQLSGVLATELGTELQSRGMKEARPAEPGDVDVSGASHRIAGGLGPKRIDVSWSTEQSGLLFGITIKTINFRDRSTHNFQKNLTNRCNDLLSEALTLHRRFPYAVLAGFLCLDKDAEQDSTSKRNSTFHNAHSRLRLFTGRDDTGGRYEQFERLYILLVDATPLGATVRAYHVGQPDNVLSLSEVVDELIELVADRNADFYENVDGTLVQVAS